MAGISPEAGLKLLLSGEKSDFTIKCQEVEFKVHQLIIKADSDFWRVICDSPFKESEEACVSLEEDDPEIIARVLEYLYTGVYTEERPPEIPGLPPSQQEWVEKIAASQDAWIQLVLPLEPETKQDKPYVAVYVLYALETHVRVYACADRLGLPRLCAMAFGAFKSVFLPGRAILSESQIASLLSLVYDTTPSSDVDLRYYLTFTFLTIMDEKSIGAASVVIKQHEPLMAKLGDTHREALRDLRSLKLDRAGVESTRAAEIISLKAERDKLQSSLAHTTAQLHSARRDGNDAWLDHGKEMTYIDHAFSERKATKYCGYCGDKGSLTTGRRRNPGTGKMDCELTCPKFKESRFIERLEQ